MSDGVRHLPSIANEAHELRIALFENLYSGGSKREAFELTRALTEHGHVVDHWTTTAADSSFLPLTRVTRRQYSYPWPAAMTIPRRLPGLRNYLNAAATAGQMRRIDRLARQMASAIDEIGYDFVFAHHCRLVQAPYLLRYLRTSSVYFCHEPMRRFYEPPLDRPYSRPASSIGRLQRRWYAPARRAIDAHIKRADARNAASATLLLTNSHFSAEAIYKAYGCRAFVSYLGVDTDVFRPLGLPRRDFVLSVGTITPLKGYDFLIEAIGYIDVQSRPPLLLVGNTTSASEAMYLRELAGRRGVSLEIRLSVPDGELVSLYNQARVMVYAPVLEPFGLAPLEAMACGTPVVAVAEGGVRESVQHNVTGILTQRDPRLFAAALQQVLDDEALHARSSSAAASSIRSFWTWPHAYERFMELVSTRIRLNDRRTSDA